MSKVFTITEGLENMGALRTGGQGSVYKGRRIGPIISAVKLLPTPVHSESMDDVNYRSFINEVEKLKKVNEIPNPNVVKILNSGITESGSFPFIEMEFIEGPDLCELLKPPHEKVFTIKEVIKVADQLACALSHCHKVGVKHGDIKSNNVKFNIHSGNYVLLDFGLSVMSDEQRRSSMRHAGAIEFMAPEQYEGEMLFQTDVYSFGVVLYELLAGRVPFLLGDNGESARNAVMLAHRENTVPDLIEFRKEHFPASWPEHELHVPAWLLQLIGKCLEKNPEERYPDGQALHDAISRNIIAESEEGTAAVVAKLTAENSHLHDQVEHFKRERAADGSVVKMPKALLAGLVILLLGAFAYAIIKPGAAKTAEPPVAHKDSTAVVHHHKKPVLDMAAIRKIKLAVIDSIKKDSVKRDSIKRAAAKKAALIHKKAAPKKKKKKFLGLF
ncbi:serine/threonine-protein kinase [Mucilaginibacter sp. L3T2-6]|uniref:serine/threonine protein kinase n=1 Tax=Mucilaginibacter sp. L3T2-6 TaxID=3062491 RepID=UPI002676B193|nr:serine/threonine-protein kinase [Mucilaginibacter sp. L3T2-6]MDO3645010.1 serine/threonine-protein kinase [Mucilaginibacter sp. L3T2-6]MDV6217461.1 serine/threonine-protein kinase [Mucilaginibacter sp. L3T2-6]